MIDGSRLKDLRVKFGYTKEEIAELLGIGVANIWRYETGKTDPSSQIVAGYARLFNVSADYLLGLADEMGTPESDLSIPERRIISAYRRGDYRTAIKVILDEGDRER